MKMIDSQIQYAETGAHVLNHKRGVSSDTTAETAHSWEESVKYELSQLMNISQKRELSHVEEAEFPWLKMNGRSMFNLASNNYLGLAGDDRLKESSIRAIQQYGVGSTASRLIVGNHPAYEMAESALIDWKKAESGLILQSGYTANTGIISALAGRNDVIFSDKLNHASIVDGILLSGAKHQRYRHNDLDHLAFLLKKAPQTKQKLIVTDTIFSMDGDQADLERLVELKERFGAILMVDEAHSSGLYGAKGEGLVHHFGLQDKVDIQMGTFSKALGCFGAYVVGKRWLIDYLMNKMRSFIFSTALPPAVLGSIRTAINIVQVESARRKALHESAAYFRNELSRFGFHTGHSESQIIPIIIGSNQQAVTFSKRLQQEGIAAIAVRPPTVSQNEARIRFTVMADHQKYDLSWGLRKIVQVGKALKVIG